jgi:hypothetical protein
MKKLKKWYSCWMDICSWAEDSSKCSFNMHVSIEKSIECLSLSHYRVALSDGTTDPSMAASTISNPSINNMNKSTGYQVHISFRSKFDDSQEHEKEKMIEARPTETWLRKVFIGKGRLLDVTIKVYNIHEVCS